jgi:uncharacterized membrane protein
MVSMVVDSDGHWRYVLRPNRSASWSQIKIFFALVASVSVSIALVFTALGFWPVLPFAGAELIVLWCCLCRNASAGDTTEVIDIDADTVAVARGRRTPQRRWSFERCWARIRLEPAPARLHPSRLLIGSHGRSVRLGSFLTEDERTSLARALRNTLASA